MTRRFECRECGATGEGEPISLRTGLPRAWERYSLGSDELVCYECVGRILDGAKEALRDWCRRNPEKTHLPAGVLPMPGVLGPEEEQ